MNVKTSTTSPIRADFIEGTSLALTLAPGKSGPSLVGNYEWARSLAEDVVRLKQHYRVERIVTLLEDAELELLGIAGIGATVRSHGLAWEWHPIRDRDVPRDRGGFRQLIDRLTVALGAGETIVVHCRGGLGRAGTVAACVLVAQGASAEDAIGTVRNARPGAIETLEQERFVASFAIEAREERAEEE